MAGRLKPTVAAVALIVLAASPPAIAGSGNTLNLSQQGTANTIQIDQSNASDSTVGGVAQPLPASGDGLTSSSLKGSASQNGYNNSAEMTITGVGGTAGLLQDNSMASTSKGNTATLALSGGALGLVGQLGDHNSAALTVSGANAFGGIIQDGSNNTGSLSVTGASATGKLIQNGDNNTFGLGVVGLNGGSASYTINGNNVTTTVSPQVVTNGASVTIVQTAP